MKKTIYYLFFGLFFNVSCKEKQNLQMVEHSVGNLIFNAPNNMKLTRANGIDSYAAYLIDDKKDTFHIEYGAKNIIDNLYTPSPTVFSLQSKERFKQQNGKVPSFEGALFSEYPEEDQGQKIFDKNYFLYDTVNNIIVKIVQPKRIGDGLTGMYIPKLKDGKSFSIYAINLDSNSHRNAIEIFKSFRYK